jgi:redox-sensitive bicupin YhaK (pirin superfamily)
METYRKVRKIINAHKVREGAGVLLHRAIGFDDPYEYDPFLLLDDFRSDNPQEYIKGFPWHPHRGIETITYVTKGNVKHEDSIGNKGEIGPGDIQWMTAGSGIYHQEMPYGDSNGAMYGFQLWANLPAKNKMINPRYRGFISNDIPIVQKSGGIEIKVICGTIDGITGPIKDVVTSPEYFDISIPRNSNYIQNTKKGSTVLLYVYEGEGEIINNVEDENTNKTKIKNRTLVLFEDGDKIKITSNENGVKFLFISGMPIKEQIAWYGPIVMNTQEELRIAYDELEKGTFVKIEK